MTKRKLHTDIPELDLFSKPKAKKQVVSQINIVDRPTTSTLNNPNLEVLSFEIPASGKNAFIALDKTKLQMEIQILDKNNDILKDSGSGENLVGANSKVGFVNGGFHAMFTNVDVSFNYKKLSTSNLNYPYISYISNLFGISETGKKSYLTSELWADDGDNLDEVGIKNPGYKERARNFGSGTNTLISGINSPMFKQSKHIPPGISIQIDMKLNKPGFFLMSDQKDSSDNPVAPDSYKIRIKEAKLFVTYVEYDKEIRESIERELIKQNMIYPIKRLTCKAFPVKPNSKKINISDLSNGQLPEFLIMGFVKDDAYEGVLNKSPFNFGTHNVQSLSLNMNNRTYTTVPLTSDIRNPDFAMTYMNLFETLGLTKDGGANSIPITESKFINGYALYPTRFEPEGNEEVFHVGDEASIDVDIEFSEIPTETLQLIVYYVYNNTVEIDKYRNCTTDG